MLNFFKSFGKGILYVLVLPVLLVILALYAVFALFGFLYLTIKGIILFFTGRSLFDDLPEDKKAKAIIKANTINPDDYVPEGDMPYVEEKEEEPVVQSREPFISPAPQNDPFYVPEYLRPEQQRVEETPVVEEKEEESINENDFLFERVEREEVNKTPVEETRVDIKEEKEDIPYVHTNYDENDDEYEDDDDGNWNSTDTLRL